MCLQRRAIGWINRVSHIVNYYVLFFFFSSRRRHTRLQGDWSSDVCSSDLERHAVVAPGIFDGEVAARDVATHELGIAPERIAVAAAARRAHVHGVAGAHADVLVLGPVRRAIRGALALDDDVVGGAVPAAEEPGWPEASVIHEERE